LPYVIAVAVVDGNVLPASFQDEKLRDPLILATLPKIKVVADPEIDALFPQVKRARVTITTMDGQQYSSQCDVAKGAPEEPLTDEDLEAKFRANATGVVSETKMDDIIEATWEFDQFEDVGQYMRLLVADL
jgi:2-methylcitrate dehydratase